jgi:hypothetical protein
MRRSCLPLFLIVLLTAATAYAGAPVLSGPLSGIWPAGSVYTIGDYAYVPAEKSLLVQEGVQIIFLTDATFDVLGSFNAIGTSAQPIVITAPDNWGGIFFTGDRERTDTLRYVIIGQEGGMPRYAVRSLRRSLVVENCTFTAQQTCLEVTEAHLWAVGDYFLTTQLFSRTVVLESLIPVSDFPPGTAPRNCLKSCLVMADAPEVFVSPFDRHFTTALEVESSNPTVVVDNTFSVQAPGLAYGVYYGDVAVPSAEGATIEHCVITAYTYNVQARGVVNAHEGDLDVRRCDIHVGGGPYSPIGISASNSAQSYVNSCIVQVATGGRFSVAEWGANITIMYTDRWAVSPNLGTASDPPPFDSKQDPDTGAGLGVGNFSEDPQFVQGCEWGHWVNLESVRDYYSLRPTSPCIDRGDFALGLDPDNTRADVGCFYYPQVNESPDLPVGSVPVSMLLEPYPNPFNSWVAVPFVLQRAGDVKVTAYDILGRPVAELAEGRYSVGDHLIRFEARGLASGLYFVTMDVNGVRSGTRRMTLIR